jgi:hypothetical protein
LESIFNGRIVIAQYKTEAIPILWTKINQGPLTDGITIFIITSTYHDAIGYTHVSEFKYITMRGANGDIKFIAISGNENNSSKSKKFIAPDEWTPGWSATWPDEKPQERGQPAPRRRPHLAALASA